MQERQEMWVWTLGWEDPQEKGMATHSSISRIMEDCIDRGAWWATVHGVTKSHMTECTCEHTHRIAQEGDVQVGVQKTTWYIDGNFLNTLASSKWRKD